MSKIFAFFSLFVVLAVATIFAQPLDSTGRNDIDLELQRELVIYHSSTALNLDPHTSAYVFEAQILNSVYEGLFSYNPATLEPDKALAEEYRISRDKKRWTFTIRQNAQTSSGQPITPQAIKDSWLNLIATKGAYYSSLLDVVKGAHEYRLGTGERDDVAISVIGNKLSVELVKPTSHLNRILCHHAFSVVLDDSSASGPYYVERVDSKEITLKKNEMYWNADEVHIPQITIRLTENTEEQTFAYNTGAADWVDGPAEINKILNKNAIQLSAQFGTEYLFFKNDSPIWSKPEFRNAVLEAIPWKQLRGENMFPATTFVFPLANYQSPEGFDFSDLDEAKFMLEAAKQKYNITDRVLPLVFAIPDNEYMIARAEILRGPLAEIGVDLRALKIPMQTYLSSISRENADLFLYTWIGDFSDPLAFLELFRGDSSMNDSKWKSEEYDELLDKAMFTNDTKERYTLLSQAEDILLSSGEIIPISHPVTCSIIDLGVIGGWVSNAMDIHPFKSLYFKKTEEGGYKNVVIK